LFSGYDNWIEAPFSLSPFDRNYREGRKPFGTRPGEQETIGRIHELRRQGLAYDTIAERLNGLRKSKVFPHDASA